MRSIVTVLVLTSVAHAQPAPGEDRPVEEHPAEAPPVDERPILVLADVDLELARAVENTLATRNIALVTWEVAPATNDEAGALARERGARFVAWRNEGQLIVYDVETGSADQQETKIGALEPAEAATAAALVLQLMHLPPPPSEDNRPHTVIRKRTERVREEDTGLRAQLGFTIRVTRGDDQAIGPRICAGVLARPWATIPLRLGLAGEAGPTAKLEKMGFNGTWRDWSALAVGSWTFEGRTREVEPFVAAGITRSLVRGMDDMGNRSESSTIPLFRLGAAMRWRFGPWSAGGVLSFDVMPTAPSLDSRDNDGTLYQVSRSAIAFGLFVAADLGL